MKTEVYSWRVSTETKMGLEAEARKAGMSLSALLDRIAKEWLLSNKTSPGESREEQARLHAAALEFIGTISGGNSLRSENVRSEVRKRLLKRHGR
jgi:hypothetical protein